MDLIDIEPNDWEIELIKKFDLEALKAYSREAQRQKNSSGKK